MTLTLNSPSPDKSQVHLSLEDERTTEFRIEERSSHCCRSASSAHPDEKKLRPKKLPFLLATQSPYPIREQTNGETEHKEGHS
ncbi:hypothetical protein Tco_1402027 [Tanacetum coccineum]